MNLVGTLGKMLLSGAMSRGTGGNVLGSLLGGGSQAGAGGDLGGLLGGLLSGKAGAGGLGDLMSKAGQGGGAGAGQGGIGDLLGGMLGGAGGAAGGGGLGDLLGSALGQQAPGTAQPPQATAAQSDHAALLIRAMINAAKSDGAVDAQEQEKIVGQLGDIGQEEAAFIRAEMSQPLDTQGFVNSVPRGMEQQVYLLSLMSIDLDSKAEAEYLDQLGKGLNISNEVSNQLHTEVGAPPLYT